MERRMFLIGSLLMSLFLVYVAFQANKDGFTTARDYYGIGAVFMFVFFLILLIFPNKEP